MLVSQPVRLNLTNTSPTHTFQTPFSARGPRSHYLIKFNQRFLECPRRSISYAILSLTHTLLAWKQTLSGLQGGSRGFFGNVWRLQAFKCHHIELRFWCWTPPESASAEDTHLLSHNCPSFRPSWTLSETASRRCVSSGWYVALLSLRGLYS